MVVIWSDWKRSWISLRTKRRNKFAYRKISSWTSATLFAAISPPEQRTCNCDISADRNVCNRRLCDCLRLNRNNSLYDRLWSSTIIWKPAFMPFPRGNKVRKQEIGEPGGDQWRSCAIVIGQVMGSWIGSFWPPDISQLSERPRQT